MELNNLDEGTIGVGETLLGVASTVGVEGLEECNTRSRVSSAISYASAASMVGSGDR